MNLAGFDATSRQVIAAYEALGWTFHRSNRNHGIGRSPDGRRTTSVSRQLGRTPRNLQNALADLRRAQKAQENEDSAA